MSQTEHVQSRSAWRAVRAALSESFMEWYELCLFSLASVVCVLLTKETYRADLVQVLPAAVEVGSR